uniref:SPOC domain containing protein n=2 Tax=Babesia bovis TaxID=5865 RepID=A7ATZ2_BABBO|eukprot:XP_001609971.1 SPOC domain containing protein [Babesia bovis T2Bo]
MDLRLCDFLRVQAPHIFARHQVEDDGPYHGSRSATGRRRSRVNQDTRTHIPDPYHIDDRSGSIDDTGSGVDHPTSKSSPQRRSGRRDNSLPRAASSRRIEEKQLWTGKLARNGKKQVDTVAVPLMGNLDVVLSGGTDVVNITHRLKWEDAEKTSHIAVFYFKAQRVENTEDFRDYITYFQEKQRIGVATMGNGISIYVCAPGAPLYNQYAKEVNEQGPL